MLWKNLIKKGSLADRPAASIEGRLFSVDQVVYIDTGTAWEIFTQPTDQDIPNAGADLSYDNSTTGLSATTIQEAIDELFAEITAGVGTVTNTGGDLDVSAIVIGAGGADLAVVPGLRTDGISRLEVGQAGTSEGGINFENATSGVIGLRPATGSLGTRIQRLPIRDGQVSVGGLFDQRQAITSGLTVDIDNRGYLYDATSGTFSIALTAAATLGGHFYFAVYNSGAGVVTIDPNSSETITDESGSATTKTLAQYEGAIIFCTGAAWVMMRFGGSTGGGGGGGTFDVRQSWLFA